MLTKDKFETDHKCVQPIEELLDLNYSRNKQQQQKQQQQKQQQQKQQQ
jgi:hypothetical protein